MTYVLIYLTRTSAGTCLSEAHRGGEGDKGKHDTETLVSHQNRPTGPLCHCCVFPNLLSFGGQVGNNLHMEWLVILSK